MFHDVYIKCRKEKSSKFLLIWEQHSITAVCTGSTSFDGLQPEGAFFTYASMVVGTHLRVETSAPSGKSPAISDAFHHSKLIRKDTLVQVH